MNKNDTTERGKQGEDDLNAWLQATGLSYIAVCQSRETFAPLFQGNLKRPDFLVLFESIGLIAVDAKCCTLSARDEYTITIEADLLRALSFERVFRIPLWYAFRAEEDDKIIWYWISALKALEVGQVRPNRKKQGHEFRAIPRDEFVRIETNEDLGKLYTVRLRSLAAISGFSC